MTDRRKSIAYPHAQSEIDSSRRYVAYYRVSTGRQGRFGFSIEAQRAAVNDYVASNPGVVVAELSEAMSGRRNDRPALSKALSLCRIARATLVIARLDRLSRNVEMIARLMESGLEFVAADFPHANRFTIHILAAVAEYESRLNSERMKEAIAARRERGARIGSPVYNGTRRFPPGCQRASAIARKTRSEARAWDLAPLSGRLSPRASPCASSPKSSKRAALRLRHARPGRKIRSGELRGRPWTSLDKGRQRGGGSGPRRTRSEGALARSARFCWRGGAMERPIERLQPSSGGAASARRGEAIGGPRQSGAI
jgi:DNA invertase Pin-like site-specific DNA recombinase